MDKLNDSFDSQGYNPQSRTDRRFFIARLLELIREGTVEFFYPDDSRSDSQKQRYIRLAPESTSESDSLHNPGENVELDEDTMLENIVTDGALPYMFVRNTCSKNNYFADGGSNTSTLTSTKTLHRQVVEKIESSGAQGITLNVSSSISTCSSLSLHQLTPLYSGNFRLSWFY